GQATCLDTCPQGLFGARCGEHCDCGDNVTCHHITGACDCPSGWRGRRCEKGEMDPSGETEAPKSGKETNCIFNKSYKLWQNRLLGCCKKYCLAGCCGIGSNVKASQHFHLLACLPAACLPGSFGKNCASRCACPPGVPCHHVTGRCGCPPGFTGSGCEKTCLPGTFGAGCAQICQCAGATQECHPVTGACVCAPGFHGPSWQPEDCAQVCSCGDGAACHPVTGDCVCPPGRAGPTCEQGKYSPQGRASGRAAFQAVGWKSGTYFLALSPLPVLGHPCPNRAALHVPTATSSGPAGCEKHRYGLGCQQTCSCRNGGLCNAADGSCLCAPGWTGKSCELECPPGRYGASCQLRCACLHNGTCDPATGACRCPAGRYGPLCEHSCPPGFHGAGCRERCDCEHGAGCEPATGRCQCPAGLGGERCQTGCAEGTFGEGCQQLCDCLGNAPCEPATGRCLCPPGKTGLKCGTDCRPTKYGPDCSLPCQCAAGSAYCNARNGQCLCLNGYLGPTCREGNVPQQGAGGILMLNQLLPGDAVAPELGPWHTPRWVVLVVVGIIN
uniref:EGF-like domain-containing protein n=1 Tax=Strix occidentalis caurina TaxID=311401 RepID=A0A8D0F6C8_STROC